MVPPSVLLVMPPVAAVLVFVQMSCRYSMFQPVIIRAVRHQIILVRYLTGQVVHRLFTLWSGYEIVSWNCNILFLGWCYYLFFQQRSGFPGDCWWHFHVAQRSRSIDYVWHWCSFGGPVTTHQQKDQQCKNLLFNKLHFVHCTIFSDQCQIPKCLPIPRIDSVLYQLHHFGAIFRIGQIYIPWTWWQSSTEASLKFQKQ